MVQDRVDALNFDKVALSFIENDSSGPKFFPPYVVDIDGLESLMKEVSKNGNADADIKRYKQFSLVGFEHGTDFSGLFRGCTGQIQMQLEGTRSLAISSLEDVSCL